MKKLTRNPQVTEAELKKHIVSLNKLVEKAGRGSCLRGLDVTAAAFAALLDIYAGPNPGNPEGMCDDRAAFRKMYATFINELPEVQRGA